MNIRCIINLVRRLGSKSQNYLFLYKIFLCFSAYGCFHSCYLSLGMYNHESYNLSLSQLSVHTAAAILNISSRLVLFNNQAAGFTIQNRIIIYNIQTANHGGLNAAKIKFSGCGQPKVASSCEYKKSSHWTRAAVASAL